MIFESDLSFLLLNFFNDKTPCSNYKFDYDDLQSSYSDQQIKEHLEYCYAKGWIAYIPSPVQRQAYAKLTPQGEVYLESLCGLS